MTIAVTHSTPADGSFSSTGAAAWNADHTLTGVGTIAEQDANNVAITGGSITGITDLAVADGGTGASTASDARTNLGLVIGTDVLSPTGSAAGLTSFPTFNQNTTGTASNVTGTVAIANGGTGQTTRQDAMDALAGAVTSGQYLRGNGTDVVMSAIQVADVPTLNQNTTGTSSNVTGTVAVANGGTGATTASGARTNLGLVIGTDVLAPNGSAASLTSFPTFNQNTTGTASNVTGIVAVANGGTGTATPSLVAGTNVTITGSFPNQTINASGGGGGGSSPIPKLQSWSIGGF